MTLPVKSGGILNKPQPDCHMKNQRNKKSGAICSAFFIISKICYLMASAIEYNLCTSGVMMNSILLS